MLENIDLPMIVTQYFCLLFALCFHEAAHAWMASRCGDQTARFLGRITMNPIKHIDPIGTVVMPILMMLYPNVPLIGWAKPVPFNPNNLNNRRRDPLLIAAAGPLSNLLLAIVFTILLKLLLLLGDAGLSPQAVEILGLIGQSMILINLVLFLFNFIPVPPLDGHYILGYFLPPSGQAVLQQIGPFGIFIAIFVGPMWIRFALTPFVSAINWFLFGF